MRGLLPVVLLLAASLAFAQTAPVLLLDFEQGFDAQSPAGLVEATLDGKPELAAGRFGQALKSGPSTGYLNFPTTMLRPTAGTVEMWVCPLDWTPAATEFHVFFDARSDGALYLYKFADSRQFLMLSGAQRTGPYSTSYFPVDWKPGEWHHLAGTWSGNGVLAYVDGKPAPAGPIEPILPGKLGASFLLGDHPWHLPRTSSSLIDEVRLYDRALSPAHIAAHAAGQLDFAAPLDAKSAFLRCEIDGVKQEMQVFVGTGGADVSDADLSAKIAFVGKGAPLPADLSSSLFVGGQILKLMPMETRAGQYELVAQFLQRGQPAFELRRAVEMPDTTSWVGNKLGTEDKVLPPWTPVQVTGNEVSVWDREYDFSGGNLVSQITSGAQPLLAGPVQVRRNGYVHDRVTDRVTASATGTRATITHKPSYLSFETTVEYDGLALFTVAGKLPADTETLSVDIPVRPEIALYRHRYTPDWDSGKVTGNLPAGDGVLDHDKFIPFYWLGNNDRGLFWMCESDEGWPNGDAPNAVEVVREKGKVILRLNLLAKGQKLPDNWRFTFGLQATPVKPLPADWRKWRLQSLMTNRRGNVSIIWPTPQKDSLRYFGYPEATDPKLMTERFHKLQAEGVSVVPYLCLSYLSAGCPEWPLYRKYWAMGGIDTTCSDVAAYGVGFALTSPLGKGYADFIVWKTAQFMKQFGIDGLYHDNTHPYGSAGLDAGCGYMRDGQLRPTFPILGYRDLYRRMYSVMKEAKPNGFTMAHMSGKMTIPILAYEDSYLDGEHFSGKVKDSYLDLMSLDTFRAEFMGRQWGIAPYFLPEFRDEYATAVEPTRGLMALLMLHDVSPWVLWCNEDVANEALAALDAFGYVDSKFIAYFEAVPPATTDMKDVYVSAYQRQDGSCLLIVSNLSKEDRQGVVSINAQRLGVTLAEVVDWPSKQPVAADGFRVSLSVPRLGYRMLVVR